MCLRTTAPFLDSANPLSFDRRGRDLVCSMSSLFKQLGHGVIDELAAIVGVESANRKRKLGQHRLQGRDQPRFKDLRGGSHHFPLRHFIHSIEVINAFAPVQLIALMDGVHTQISRSALWIPLSLNLVDYK